MFSENRPFINVDKVLICCTNDAGEVKPDLWAMMNFILSVAMPRAAASRIGSGFDQPKSIRSESMPVSSAARQN